MLAPNPELAPEEEEEEDDDDDDDDDDEDDELEEKNQEGAEKEVTVGSIVPAALPRTMRPSMSLMNEALTLRVPPGHLDSHTPPSAHPHPPG